MKLLRSLAISESGFVFQPMTGETFTVNETGRLILSALQNGRDVESILRMLAEVYEADTVTLEKDLQDFLAQLQQYGLLTEEV